MMVWKRLRTWPREALERAGLCQAAKVALGIGASFAALFLIVPELVADRVERVGALFPYYGSDTARVTVEIPEIHTRERLINDRNEQVTWIEEQLRQTLAQSAFSPEPKPETAAEQSADAPSAAQDGSSVRLRSEWRAGVRLADRPLDRFKELNAFREVVRTERAHAMLDDRHDLDGNTLYFLSFDATVLPGRKSRGYAVVSAWLSQPPGPDDDAGRKALADSNEALGAAEALGRFDDLRRRDELDIYLDWLDRVRLRMKDAVDATTAALGAPDVRIQESGTDKIGPLETRLCLLMVKPTTTQERREALAACRDALRGEEPVDGLFATAARTAVAGIRAAEKKATSDLGVAFAARYYKRLADTIPDLHEYVAWQRQARGGLSDSALGILNLIDEDPRPFLPDYAGAVAVCAPIPPPDRVKGFAMPALAQLAAPDAHPGPAPVQPGADAGTLQPRAETRPFPLPCPEWVTVSTTLDVLALIEDALKEDRALNAGALADLKVEWRSPGTADLLRSVQPDVMASLLVRHAPEVPGLFLGARPWVALDDVSPRCLAARIEEERFNDGAPGLLGDRGHDFSEFFDTQIVVRGTNCYVDVLQKMFWSETPEATAAARRTAASGALVQVAAAGGPSPVSVRATENKRWDKLQMLLQAATGDSTEAQPAAYSYGLSPRLRRGFTSDQSANAGASLSWNGYGAEARDTQQFSGTVYDPEIVGFTPRLGPGCGTADASRPDCAQARAASFGWIIGPRREGAGQGWRRLAVEQAQLGAFVAVPSWWRTVLLRVCTGFATERGLPGAPDWWASTDAPGPDPKTSCRVHALRLPGTAAEFDRRLGIQVVRFPYIRTRQSEDIVPELRVGERGSLLIEGGRLWRSTEVMVGAQRATRIRVLPNMEAITAEFRCVDRPTAFSSLQVDKRDDGQYRVFTVPARVWTSEGTTQYEMQVRVVEPDSLWQERRICYENDDAKIAAPVQPSPGRDAR